MKTIAPIARIAVLAAALSPFFTGSRLMSAVIATYDADVTNPAQSPTSQGWTQSLTGTAPTAGSETIGGVTYRYWDVANVEPATNSFSATYRINYSSGTLSGSEGWTATAILRVPLAEPNVQSSLFQVGDGDTLWSLTLSKTPATDGYINYIGFNGSSINAITTYDPSNYITLQMYYDPDMGSTGVYVNGGLVGTLTRATSYDASSLFIRWGDNDSSPRTNRTISHWNFVQLETGYAVVPEPGITGLVAFGIGGILLARRKRNYSI